MRRYLSILLAVILAVSLGVILRHGYDSRRAVADSLEAAELAGLSGKREQEARPDPRPALPSEPLPEVAAHLAQVDLAALRAVNKDVVGWLEIPGTQLSYPLVQGEDNQYYLTHNWKRESSTAGSVFLEQTNPRDLSGFHLIAYGHRMRNGSIFGSLRRYSDPAYLQEHPSIYLVDKTAVRRYDIFAAYEAGVTSLVYRLDLEEKELEEAFIDFCLASSAVETGVVPEPGSQILTLSTCTGHGYESRWVVQGYLSRRYELTCEARERSIS